MVAEHEVHTQATHIESSRLLFAEGRHKQAGRALRFFRDEAEGEADKRQFHILHHEVGRTYYGLLARLLHHLRSREGEIVVRVVGIADRIFSVGDIDGPVFHHLDVAAVEYTLVIIGYHIVYECLAGVEVIVHILHFILLSALLHHRSSHPFHFCGVVTAPGIDRPGFHVVLHIIRSKLHILVGDLHLTIIIYLVGTGLGIPDREHGVAGIGEGRVFQAALAEECHRIGAAKGIHDPQRVPACNGGRIRLHDLLLYSHAVSCGISAPGPPVLR